MTLLPKALGAALLGAVLTFTPLLYGGPAQQRTPAASATPAQAVKPTAGAQDPVEPVVAQAQAALDRNDFPAAIPLLQQIVAARPAEALPHFELGYAFSQLQQNTEAIAEFRRAIALNDALAAAHLNLGLLLRDSDPADAAASFRRAAELMPGEGRPHYLAGSALEKSGKLPEAVAEYQSAVTLAPKDPAMRMALGRALLRTDRGSEAEAQFREAGTLNGGPPASLALAEALLQQGKHAEAAEQFSLYLKDAPGDRNARFERAVALQNAARFDQALAELDRLDQDGPPTTASLKLRGGIYLQQKQWTPAAGALEKAAPASPNDAELYAWLGHARLNLHDFPAAETALSRSLALDPSPAAPLRDLVDVRYFSNQCAPALQSLDLLAQRAAPIPLDWFFRATCYDKLGQTQDAATAYQKFLDVDAGALPDQELSARLRLKLLLRELEQKKGSGVGQDKTSYKLFRALLLIATAFAICTACGTAAQAQDRLGKYQAQYDADANPVRRAKLLGQMGTLEIDRARSIFKSGQDEESLDVLQHYRDEVQKTMDGLTGMGVDAVRHPAGFKELQIGLRVSVRQLDDMILTIPVDKRPFFRTVRTDLADAQNKLIDLLFPGADKGITKE